MSMRVRIFLLIMTGLLAAILLARWLPQEPPSHPVVIDQGEYIRELERRRAAPPAPPGDGY